jgi:hypothetical protein
MRSELTPAIDSCLRGGLERVLNTVKELVLVSFLSVS